MIALVALVSCCAGGILSSAFSGTPETREIYVESDPQTVTQPPVTVQRELPESCIQAIQHARDLLDKASNVASANGRQLDIIDEAYQAVLLGDTQALNAAAQKQIALDLELSSDKAKALIPYQQIQDGLQTCLA
jgi:hypothetical protein